MVNQILLKSLRYLCNNCGKSKFVTRSIPRDLIHFNLERVHRFCCKECKFEWIATMANNPHKCKLKEISKKITLVKIQYIFQCKICGLFEYPETEVM